MKLEIKYKGRKVWNGLDWLIISFAGLTEGLFATKQINADICNLFDVSSYVLYRNLEYMEYSSNIVYYSNNIVVNSNIYEIESEQVFIDKIPI